MSRALEYPSVGLAPLRERLTGGTTGKGPLLAIIAIAAGDVKEWPASQIA